MYSFCVFPNGSPCISDMETDFPDEKLTDINDNCEEEFQNTDSEESAVGKYQNSLKGLCDPAVQTK